MKHRIANVVAGTIQRHGVGVVGGGGNTGITSDARGDRGLAENGSIGRHHLGGS